MTHEGATRVFDYAIILNVFHNKYITRVQRVNIWPYCKSVYPDHEVQWVKCQNEPEFVLVWWSKYSTLNWDFIGSWWHHQMEIFSALLSLLCGEFIGHRWIPRIKASCAELWCFLWSAPWVNNGEAGDLRHPLWCQCNVRQWCTA